MECPVCSSESEHNASIPFNKSCEGGEPSGEPVAYRTCKGCGFTWAPDICSKEPAWFAEHIYNADYLRFDPDYWGQRASNQAKNLIYNYHWVRKQIRHLDYGSGGGQLTERMVKAGFDSTPYDPFVHTEAPTGKFNLITCFEVFEHVPDPQALMRDLAGFLADEGVLIASTLLLEEGTDLSKWWYAAPRNGHISLYPGEALGKLAVQHRLQARISTGGTHTFFKRLPPWA